MQQRKERMKLKDSRLKDKARELLSRMTVEEKLAQMVMKDCDDLFDGMVLNTGRAAERFGTVGCGALQFPKQPVEESTEKINQLHRFFKNTMRLPIPPFFIAEALHGLMIPNATIFPQSISLASTWNDALIGRVAEAIAEEASAAGVTQTLCPDLDLCRDPRWGRIEETFGEDAYLASRMGVAYVKNLQGGAEADCSHVAATLKHFTAHGTPEGGINLAPVQVGERAMQEYYLKPFRDVIREAAPISVMPAYSELDGVPCSSSKRLLTDILRNDLGFDGYTISDFGAMEMLVSFHHTAENEAEAGRQALHAGMDFEAPCACTYGEAFVQLVKEGRIPMEEVDQAVEHILIAKLKAHLFDSDKTSFHTENASGIVGCEKNKHLAYEAASEAIVLLENRNNLLPLKKDLRSIAVIGPNADMWQIGDYTIDRPCKTPLQAIKERAGENVDVRYSLGCGTYDLKIDCIEEAVGMAAASDVVILCLGGSSTIDYGIGWGQDSGKVKTCGEGFDVSSLDLPGNQQKLAEAVILTGVPVVVVHIDGRPASIPWIASHCSALLEMWYGGQEGADALADILFGSVNPSGRLPVSIPESVGQLPSYYNYKPSGRGCYHKPGSPENPGRDYVFANPKPLYPFGYGKSYTTFSYSNLTAAYNTEKSAVEVSVQVKNTGNVSGKEVVSVYLHDVVASVTRPVRELKDFKKIFLVPDETQTVHFRIPKSELAFLDEAYQWVVEPGKFQVFVAELSTEFFIPTEM